MEIQHKETDNKGKFFIEKDGEQIALMTYTRSGDSAISIDHTEVDDSLQGEGIGEKLVKKGVEFARENDLEIVPLCPFVKAIIDKTPEFQDILK